MSRDLRAGLNQLLRELATFEMPAHDYFCLSVSLEQFDEWHFLLGARSVPRFYYCSRDLRLELFGLGVCERLVNDAPHKSAVSTLDVRRTMLAEQQFYFGGMRFDSNSPCSEEWRSFGIEHFVIPLLQVIKDRNGTRLLANFTKHAMPVDIWARQVQNLCMQLMNSGEIVPACFLDGSQTCEPSFLGYQEVVTRALKEMDVVSGAKKVVLGRRNTVSFTEDVDPMELFLTLKSSSHHAHYFFFEHASRAFFGASPELLYRRVGHTIYSESLAGTLARTEDESATGGEQEALLHSNKDQSENGFVAQFVKERLGRLGAHLLDTSDVEVVTLPYVHHLVRHFKAELARAVSEQEILDQLHPTPAVCGLEGIWARHFISTYEGFDRGFFAGPIGIVSRDISEFCVGIRSALYERAKLHVYAASGIVHGSRAEREWEELTYKQKNIMGIIYG